MKNTFNGEIDITIGKKYILIRIKKTSVKKSDMDKFKAIRKYASLRKWI